VRITDFIYGIIDRFAPMQQADKNQLRNEAGQDYVGIRNEFYDDITRKLKDGFTEDKLKPKQKIVLFLEDYKVRTVLALVYVWVENMIQNWGNETEEDDED